MATMSKTSKAQWDKAIIRHLRNHNRLWEEHKIARSLYMTSVEENRTDLDWLNRSVKMADEAMLSFRSAMFARDSAWIDGYSDIDFDALVAAAKEVTRESIAEELARLGH